MAGYVEGVSRDQATPFPERLDEPITADAPVRVVDAFVDGSPVRLVGGRSRAAIGDERIKVDMVTSRS